MKLRANIPLILTCITLTLGLCACQPVYAPQLIHSGTEISQSTETNPGQFPTEPSAIPSSPTPSATIVPTEKPTEQPSATPEPKTQTEGPYCAGPEVHLDIPDRNEDENAPEDGWCGETSIQMALNYYGKNISQQAINLAGKPKHPDLWEDEIPVALDTLGVKYTAWEPENPDTNGYITWLGEQLQAGYPVVIGLKIYPDETGWDNDHFVLAVGCDTHGIIINTNNAEEGQIYVTYKELTKNFVDSYSFINDYNLHYGWAIQGLQ